MTIRRSHIGHNVTISQQVQLGDRCWIESGARIGRSGFGYEQKNGRWEAKPERGGVIIEDDVHIGSNTCIDRGSWRDTVIGSGSRIDNLVHVAHNVHLGQNCIVVAHAGLGGSCEIGDGAWIGFGALIRERVKIGERALIGMGAVVLADVPADQTWAGNPARCINPNIGVREQM